MIRITRIIVDECVGARSALMQRFRQTLPPAQPVEFVHLGKVHRAIPNVELLRRLLKGLAAVEVLPCAKGPFFERMERKLQQLACSPRNEPVALDFDRVIGALNDCPA